MKTKRTKQPLNILLENSIYLRLIQFKIECSESGRLSTTVEDLIDESLKSHGY